MIKPDRKMKREADRAYKRFDERGCCRCGMQPTPGVLEVLVRGDSGTLRAVHSHCVRTVDTVLATGTFVANVSPYLADDRQWFEANPSRLASLRWPFDASETKLLVNHAHLAELKQSGQSAYSDRLREQLRIADTSRVAILVLRKAPGVRMRVVMFLDREFNKVTIEAIEAAGADLLAKNNIEVPSESDYVRNLAEIQLLEVSAIAARVTGKPSIADVARAVGESRSATWH